MKYNIEELLEKKKNSILSDREKEQLKLIEIMMKDRLWYRKVDFNTAAGMLLFLGIPKNEIPQFYFTLISQEDSNHYDKYELIEEDNIQM